MKLKSPSIRIRKNINLDGIIDLMCGLSIIMILPFFMSISSYISYGIRFGLGLVFMLCVAQKDKNLFFKMIGVMLSGLGFTLIYMYNVRMAYGEGIASFVARSMLCWLYMTFALYYAKHRSASDNSKLGTLFTIVLVIIVIASIIGIDKYSYLVSGKETIVRVLGNGGKFPDDVRNLLNRSNIASWQLAYAFAFASVAYVWTVKAYHKKTSIVIFALIMLFLVEAQITFALLFAGIPIIYYFVKKKSTAIQVVSYSVFLIAFLVIYINASRILFFIYEMMMEQGADMLGLRFYQLYEASKTGALVGTGAGRMKYYTISLNQFISHPIFGYKLKDSTEIFVKLGMHSQVLDTLGGTGLVGFMLYLVPFIYVIRMVRRSFSDRLDRSFVTLGIVLLIVFMFTNPTTYACEAYMVIFCLPFWLKRNVNVRVEEKSLQGGAL